MHLARIYVQYSEAYYFNLKQAFPGEWHTFINAKTDPNSQKLKFQVSSEIISPHIDNAQLKGIFFKLDAPDVLSSDVKAVSICSSNETHFNICKDALNEEV